jgi:hypothetical protein
MGPDLSRVKLAVSTFEICAFDGKFGEHSQRLRCILSSFSSCSWTHTPSSLVLVVNDPVSRNRWYTLLNSALLGLWRLWETDACMLLPLTAHCHHRIRTLHECLLFIYELLTHCRSRHRYFSRANIYRTDFLPQRLNTNCLSSGGCVHVARPSRLSRYLCVLGD